MRRYSRNISYLFSLAITALLLGGTTGRAQQGAGQKPPKPAVPIVEDEPVAVTEKSKAEKTVSPNEIGPDQFGNFRFPVINNKGDIAFIGLFNSKVKKNASDFAVFVRKTDGSWKITGAGEKPIDQSEPLIGMGASAALSDGGDLTFVGEFELPAASKSPVSTAEAAGLLDAKHGETPPMNKALYVKTAQGLKSLARLGDDVPNMPSRFTGFANASTNSKGVTAFIGTYSDPDGRGLFLVEDGKLRIVLRSGQRVGGGLEGSFSEHYYPAPINDRSEVAFLGRMGDKAGVWVSRPSGLELVALTGQAAPVKGATFIGFGNRAPAINSKGEVVFAGFTDNPAAQRALYFKGDGPLQLVATAGDSIGDANITFSDFLSPAVNSRREIAFVGLYGGRNRGMFLKTEKGIEPIALYEQQIPGGTKEEVFNNFTQPSINDRGEVVFYAQIRNGSVALFHRDEKGVLRTLIRRGDKIPK